MRIFHTFFAVKVLCVYDVPSKVKQVSLSFTNPLRHMHRANILCVFLTSEPPNRIQFFFSMNLLPGDHCHLKSTLCFEHDVAAPAVLTDSFNFETYI